MVEGFQAGAAGAGLKRAGEPDLGLIVSNRAAAAAGVFTTNRVQAAPVLLTRERVKAGTCRAVMVNSGNANCCTGEQGMADACEMARIAARNLEIPEEEVLVASTGVIGKPLPMEKIEAAAPGLVRSLSADGWPDFARSILTTDTKPKLASRRVFLGDASCTIAAAAKGAGMIRPDMATMLCFAATDAAVPPGDLQAMLKAACDASFNRITIDGDMSTNDMAILMAGGASGARLEAEEDRERFQAALDGLFVDLAKQMVKDGEGATKLVEVAVQGARTPAEARRAADTVANSSLVKTALFGEDANWGRIMAAVGRSGAMVAPEKIDLFFDAVRLVHRGEWAGAAAEAEAAEVIRRPEFSITIDLHIGSCRDFVWTCDFSVDYVRINADYRS